MEQLKPLSEFYKTQAMVNVVPTSQLSTNAPTTPTPTPTSSWLTRRNVLIGLAAVGTTGLVIISGKKPSRLSTNIKSFTEKLPGGVPLEMIGIPAGKFMMGSPNSDPDAKPNEKPAHLVQVKSFAIGKYPLTRRQWLAITGLNLRKDLSYFFDFPNHPMEWITLNNAQDFCQRLKALTGKNYNLPSEAQWEYACRAGTNSRFYWGDDVGKIGDYAWSLVNSQGTSHEVGQKLPNAWGVYDMAGNVWERCSDVWHKDYKGAPIDGSSWDDSPENSKYFFCRGGAWDSPPLDCRSSRRIEVDKGFGNSNLGLRVVYSVE